MRAEAERREKAAAEAEVARLAALEELSRIEREKKATADREAARLAALKRQQELEAAEALQKKVPIINRTIMPTDYKRREHEYLNVEMENAANAKPPTPPKPASQTTTP
jgi:fused signal recognition particle receptor